MRNTVRLCLLPALLAALAAVAGPAAGEEGAMDFTVDPAPRSSLDPEGGYFRISAGPGETVEQAVVLRNLSQRPIELRVAAVDAATGSYGGVSYGLPGAARERVGKWISFEQQTVRLGADAAARVSFTVAVPAGAVSGEHLGGITVWAPSSEETEESTRGAGQAGATLNIQTRRVIAVLVRVPGRAEPRLVVTGVTPTARADGVYLEIGIENRGGALTKAKGTISLPSDGFQETFALDTFVPGTATAYPIKWAQSPRDGEHQARVELRYGTRTALWEGTFTIGEEVEKALVERGAPGEIQESRDSTLTLAAAAAAAAAAAGLLVGGVIWLLSRRRRKRTNRRPPPGGKPDDQDEDSPIPSGDLITRRNRAAALADDSEPAVGGNEVAPPRHRAGTRQQPGRTLPPQRTDGSVEVPARPHGEPSHVAPLTAATAVAAGSVLWLLLRRRASSSRF